MMTLRSITYVELGSYEVTIERDGVTTTVRCRVAGIGRVTRVEPTPDIFKGIGPAREISAAVVAFDRATRALVDWWSGRS